MKYDIEMCKKLNVHGVVIGAIKDKKVDTYIIKELVEYAYGRISIMPGKGINKENRDMILEYTKTVEIHGTKIV